MKKAFLNGLFMGLWAYVLYQNIWVCVMGSIIGFCYITFNKSLRIEKNKKEIRQSFIQFLNLLLPTLSVQRPIISMMRDVTKIYQNRYGKDLFYQKMWMVLQNCNTTEGFLEKIKQQFVKAEAEEVYLFSNVVHICEKTGGNVRESIRNNIQIIRDKIEMEQETQVILAEKKGEQKIITVMPIGILFVFSWSAPSFVAPLYETTGGQVVMTLAGGLFFLQWYLGKTITKVKV